MAGRALSRAPRAEELDAGNFQFFLESPILISKYYYY
jgi:hypothetical protein